MPQISASSCSWAWALATCTPFPATRIGRRDCESISTTRCTSEGALSGLAVFRNPAALWMNGGDSTSTSPPMAADRITTDEGPGRPLMECLIAIWVASTASWGWPPGRCTCSWT